MDDESAGRHLCAPQGYSIAIFHSFFTIHLTEAVHSCEHSGSHAYQYMSNSIVNVANQPTKETKSRRIPTITSAKQHSSDLPTGPASAMAASIGYQRRLSVVIPSPVFSSSAVFPVHSNSVSALSPAHDLSSSAFPPAQCSVDKARCPGCSALSAAMASGRSNE